jgi:hypothetical protein
MQTPVALVSFRTNVEFSDQQMRVIELQLLWSRFAPRWERIKAFRCKNSPPSKLARRLLGLVQIHAPGPVALKAVAEAVHREASGQARVPLCTLQRLNDGFSSTQTITAISGEFRYSARADASAAITSRPPSDYILLKNGPTRQPQNEVRYSLEGVECLYFESSSFGISIDEPSSVWYRPDAFRGGLECCDLFVGRINSNNLWPIPLPVVPSRELGISYPLPHSRSA